ncbi:MAG: UDP-N-acetylmuramate dehydrogenase [Patescibacteria group bacterium]
MSDLFSELKTNLGDLVKMAEPLSAHTNFKIGGPAKYFFVARSTNELTRAIQVADELKLPFLILGGGSNILVSDKGFDGLVIEARNNQWSIEGELVNSDAGVNLGFLVQKVIAGGLSGLEPLVAVPGTVGGAVYGNAGIPQIKNGFIGDWIKEVVVCRDDKVIHLKKAECEFGYRQSIFKRNRDVILQVVFELKKGEVKESQELMKKYIDARRNQPYNVPSSGCIFMNSAITNADEVRTKFAGEEKIEEFIQKGQLPSSWLIDRAGLKGKAIGGAQVSDKHANYIVNVGGAKAEDVVILISFIKQQVRDQFGIQLQDEVRYIGF